MSVQYEVVIGLEVHVQLRTKSKMFCSCPNHYGAEPNTLTCPVCTGQPGALPTPNAKAIESIIRAGLMCDAKINLFSQFDRKSYFYPDMPKNYQITQLDYPFCVGGGVRIRGKGLSGAPLPDKVIRLNRIHLEEDVAKLTHYANFSGVDFNRAGVPLMEIVSEADMRSPDEAYAYLTELKRLMQYAELSDCDMEKGQMRCDVNISLRPVGQSEFGTKVELKNLNSFRAAHRALYSEIARQTELLNAGERIVQQTRGWNDDMNDSYLMRTKEDADDYRYFPDPDLPPVVHTQEYVETLRAALPQRPFDKQDRYAEKLSLPPYDVETLTQDHALSLYFEAAAAEVKNYKLLANWIITELLRALSAAHIAINDTAFTPAYMAEIVNMIDSGAISGKIAKDVFAEAFEKTVSPAALVKEKGLTQLSDSSAIDKVCRDVILACPTQVEQYKSGKTAVIQYLVGQVMKRTKGAANPAIVNATLTELLK